MASGGARASSGPPKDPVALRRDRDGGGFTILPATGRPGPAPAWPLSRRTKREAVIWNREWKRPQALMWERNGQEVEVALYVRSLIAAEKPDAPTNTRTLVKQQMESLGISVPGLTRNQWAIGGGSATASLPEPEDAPSPPPARAAGGGSARERFGVVQGGRAAT